MPSSAPSLGATNHRSMEIVVKTDEGEYQPLPEDKVVLSKSEIESDYIPRASVDEKYVPKTAFEDRLNRAVSNQIDKAHEREDVIARVLEKHTPPGADIDAAKEQWEKGRFEPLSNRYNQLRDSLRTSEVNAHAVDVFDEHYTRPLPNGKPSPIQIAISDQFEYNEEYGYVAAVDSNGNFIPSSDPSSARPFRTVSEQMASLAQDEAWSPYLKKPAKNAGGAGSPGKADPTDGRSFDPATATDEDHKAFIAKHGMDVWKKRIGL